MSLNQVNGYHFSLTMGCHTHHSVCILRNEVAALHNAYSQYRGAASRHLMCPNFLEAILVDCIKTRQPASHTSLHQADEKDKGKAYKCTRHQRHFCCSRSSKRFVTVKRINTVSTSHAPQQTKCITINIITSSPPIDHGTDKHYVQLDEQKT